MTYEEVVDLLDIISSFYKNFDITEEKIQAWLNVLQEYDKNEVNEVLKSAMAEDRFQNNLPTPYYLVRNLVKKYDKVNYKEQVVYCPICRRPLNQPQYEKHFDRCLSVEYILNQCKRFNTECRYSKKELYEMNETIFEEYYDTILKYVMNHTTDKSEKTRIGFIFNPPSEEKARQFLSKGR